MTKDRDIGFRASVAASTRYELRMQIRRKAVWISAALVSLLMFAGPIYLLNLSMDPAGGGQVGLGDMPLPQLVARWAIVVQYLLPISLGIMLADRLPRDRRTGASELLETSPSSPGGRLVGKYLGSTLATLIPIASVYAIGVCYFTVDRGDLGMIPLGLAAFLAINLPGLLFVAAFSVAVPALLWVPLYQFLFVGYWFWGNLLNPDFMPTLSGTWLTPLGGYAANGLFGAEILYSIEATAWGGVASIVALLVTAAAALYSVHRYLRRHQVQQ